MWQVSGTIQPFINVDCERIAQVLALLGFMPRSAYGGQLRGGCPLHGSTHGTARSFSVNSTTHTFHCFKCGRSGNALDFWPPSRL